MAFINKGVYGVNPDYLYYLIAGTDWSEGANKAVKGITLNKKLLSEKHQERNQDYIKNFQLRKRNRHDYS